jgi:hypothetical protein
MHSLMRLPVEEPRPHSRWCMYTTAGGGRPQSSTLFTSATFHVFILMVKYSSVIGWKRGGFGGHQSTISGHGYVSANHRAAFRHYCRTHGVSLDVIVGKG